MAASKQFARAAFAGTILSLFAALAHAAPAGSIEYTQGVATVQSGTAATHIAGPGAPVNQGDTITTAPNSYTVVKMVDGTRMTVRPDSKLVVTTYDYQPTDTGSSGSMVFSLLRGGLRAITGIIPKRDVNAARIVTPTATVGIRGTDFDARICSGDCGSGGVADARAQHANNIIASARVLSETGVIFATNAQGTRRLMATGAPIYPGDTLETPAAISAVIVFRDETRMTIQPATRMKVDDFVFDVKQPTEGRFFVSLLKGGLRAFTGIIGQANHDNVAVRTATATVGIRGTGWDVSCQGSCAGEANSGDDDGLKTTVWLGEIVLKSPSGQELLVVTSGETGFINPRNPNGSKGGNALDFQTPRPDQVKVDMALLFGETELSDNQQGLYVLVRDGHVSLETATGELDLGQGEAGFTDGTLLIRPINVPNVLQYDFIPLPGGKYGDLLSLINAQGVNAVCSR